MQALVILELVKLVLEIILEAQRGFNSLPEDLRQQHFDRMRWWEERFDKLEALFNRAAAKEGVNLSEVTVPTKPPKVDR